MHIITILNRTVNFKRFVFKKAKFVENPSSPPIMEIEIVHRKNSKAVCSGCNEMRMGYDRLPARRLEHVPFGVF
jgi:hypothetical protein